jgi:5'-3' exonuclease
MGIPYYFASLIRQHKGIVSRVQTCLNPDVFAIDFNCFIHQYMDDENPIQSILVALRNLLDTVCCGTNRVYIAMDGMVPYAKMVQQRYRRFRIPDKTPVFDRNQISPETPYMKELAKAVSEAFPEAIVSSTSEAGEGEHKLLNWLKTLPDKQRRSVVVYGLDADLILLCLSQKTLSLPYSFNLLREDATFGKSVTEGFSTLSIWKLSDRLEIPIAEYIRLSVLCFGNDFMPSLAMFSLREGGHERAVTLYKAAKCSLETVEGRAKFMKYIGNEEERVLLEKVSSRKMPFERAIVAVDGKYMKERYNAHIQDGVCDTAPVVEAFWKTYHWTLSYFTQNVEPDWGWYYPYPDAPLVCQINDYAEKTPMWIPSVKFTPIQQLQFILPSASLRTTKKRVLYPDEFYNEETDVRVHWMKRYSWESKPRISLPNLTETRIVPWGGSDDSRV